MSRFVAGVQYNDFKGSVAGDRADNYSLAEYLSEQGQLQAGERVVGYRLAFYENHGHEVEPSVVVYLQAGSFDEPAEEIRPIEIEMTTGKFFSFFKRFDMVMTVKGQTFEGVTVKGPDID
ncbi:MAG: hypothetical protein AAFQ32_12405 [Pseudomonadota bacterium]